MKSPTLASLSYLLFLTLLFLGCGRGNQSFSLVEPFGFTIGDAPTGGETSVPEDPINPGGGGSGDGGGGGMDDPPPICDPFGGSTSDNAENGIVANLSYRSPLDPGNNLNSYLPSSEGVSWFVNNLFLGELNKPTSPFDDGFIDGEGNQLKNSETGEDLIEYFALFMASRITLASGDAEGEYQFALLSDDGAVMHLDQGYGLEKLIDNDGTHPTKVKCSEPVYINKGDKLPMELGYFQAPRYHISIMLLWRHGSDLPEDPFCTNEPSGNSYFFDSTQTPPEPSQAYNDFLDRGWKVLRPENYLLPASITENPCN